MDATDRFSSSDSRESFELDRAAAGVDYKKGKKEKKTAGEARKKNTATEGSRRVKREKAEPTGKTQISAAPSQGHPIVEQWVQRALDAGVEKLREEFRQLAKYVRENMTKTAFDASQTPDMTTTKNRYQDVPCQDHCIVKLVPPAPTSYIHANFVGCPMLPDRRFICTQGPLDQTVDEFWFMILQEKVEQIVMLCKTIETGKYKCAQYWPAKAGEKLVTSSKITIENLSGPSPMDRDPEITISQLTVTFQDRTHSVRHLHWTDWPDRGVPPCKLTSLELLSAVRGSKVPIVVHCSAGIGRTGTIVAIEYILERIAEGKQLEVMPELVKQLRDQRAYSIQNDLQYLYIHRVMLNYFLEKYKEKYAAILTHDNIAKYDKFIKDYNVVVGQTNDTDTTGTTGLNWVDASQPNNAYVERSKNKVQSTNGYYGKTQDCAVIFQSLKNVYWFAGAIDDVQCNAPTQFDANQNRKIRGYLCAMPAS
ncbi:unnamed protein product [Caenorhabditis sp. 36 PRJEB53466]|nr:unnamed protein product [Caenorhabditis sp. 36 PRJEB53466]